MIKHTSLVLKGLSNSFKNLTEQNKSHKDPRGGHNANLRVDNSLPFSDEILTEKTEMDEIQHRRDQLINELASARDPSQAGANEKSSANDQEEKIKKLHE